MHISRTQQRHPLIFYLKVHDCRSGEPLGFLGDINLEGMLVVSEKPLTVGECFDIWLDIGSRGEASRARNLRCKARSMWSKADINPDYYATGFRFEDVPLPTMRAIRELIDDIGFDA